MCAMKPPEILHDEASLVDSAMAEGERRGVEAGFQKGIEQGIEISKSLSIVIGSFFNFISTLCAL